MWCRLGWPVIAAGAGAFVRRSAPLVVHRRWWRPRGVIERAAGEYVMAPRPMGTITFPNRGLRRRNDPTRRRAEWESRRRRDSPGWPSRSGALDW